MAIFYKIVATEEWEAAKNLGFFKGAGIDLKDGYIHLSTGAQATETARLHFAKVDGLLLVAIDENVVAHQLKWETSRGGQLFPHVYGQISPAQILWAKPLPWVGDAHQFPAEFQ